MAWSTNHPVLAGLLLALLACSLQQVAADGKHATHAKSVVKPHKHMKRMDPLKQLNQKQDVGVQQTAVTALLPACVPKYVTDLVLPPPMPMATRPLGFKGAPDQDAAGPARVPVYMTHPAPRPAFREGEEPAKKKITRKVKKNRRNGGATVAAADVEEVEEEVEAYDKDEEAGADVPLSSAFSGDFSAAIADGLIKMPAGILKHGKDEVPSLDEEADAAEEERQQQLANKKKRGAKAGEQQQSAQQVTPIFDPYHISARQISQQALPTTSTGLPLCPASLPPTDVYAYGPADIPGQPFHNWPGFTIEVKRNRATHIKWTNDLMDSNFNFLPHILKDAIAQTVHWANPGALGGSIDSSPCHACSMTGTCATDPACITAATTTYNGPVPIVTHVHGNNHVYDFSDGYSEAWWLPNSFGLQGNYRSIGTWYETMERGYTATTGLTWSSGSATFVYNNTQRASPLWYHDHTLGLTRTNVYAGLAGFYFVRDKFPSLANGPELPGLPYPAYDGVIPQNLVRELPLAIQDRAFTTEGKLYYPINDNGSPPNLPNGPIPAVWVPEFSANVPVNGTVTNVLMFVVNGRTYPRHTVYPDAYRLRILNGCNARTMQLRFVRSSLAQIDPLSTAETANALPFWVVGNEGGFYPELQEPVTTLEMGPAERYDLVIDFSRLEPGQFVFMLNNGPETGTAIYDGTNNGVGLTVNTAQIMRFDVNALPAGQTGQPFNLAQQVVLNAALQAQWAATVPPLVPTTYPIRRVALMEQQTPDGQPIAVLLGRANSPTTAVPTFWTDPVTTNGALNQMQIWDIINLSADSHPIHLHDVDFRYLGRWETIVNRVDPWEFTENPNVPVTNQDLDQQLTMPCATDPSGQCAVPKDTILVLPGATTRIALYGPPSSGLYVWHCHLVEHEDNEMMQQMCFGQPGLEDPRRPGQLMCPGPN